MMEKNLHKVLDDIILKSEITGVLCADSNGLCLALKGSVKSEAAGPVVQLAKQASLLEPGRIPIVRLESDTKEVLIQNNNDVTLALTRSIKR